MKKEAIFLIIASLVLVLGGCGDNNDPSQTGPFAGGSGGVAIQFSLDEPITQFGELDTVPVSLDVTNVGESDINTGDAEVKLFGIDFDIFGLSEDFKANTKTLRGKSDLFPDGGNQKIPMGDAKYKFSIRNSEEFTFRAKVCYPYQTEARVDICISSKLLEQGREKVCSIEGEKVESGTVSAGPIQVTSITESLRAADQVRFDIEIQNQGAGDVYAPTVSCSDTEDDFLRRQEQNKVEVEIVRPTDITCNFADSESNKGILELDSGSEILTCWMSADDTIKEKMNIVVRYQYVDRTERVVTIFESN